MGTPESSSNLSSSRAAVSLAQLGLKESQLREPALAAYTFAAQCTKNDPAAMPGYMVWGRTIGSLRDLLKPEGWRASGRHNYETVVHPSGSHAIAVAAGSSQTGSEGFPPRTRTRKGEITKQAVTRNAQLPLGYETDVFAHTGQDESKMRYETWVLLHYFDKDAQEIRLELSSPAGMEAKQITLWRKRIILQPIPFSSEQIQFDIEDLEEEAAEIDVDVRRKAD